MAPTDVLAAEARIAKALNERAPCSVSVATFPTEGIEFEHLMQQADVRRYDSRHGRSDADTSARTERFSWETTSAGAGPQRAAAGQAVRSGIA